MVRPWLKRVALWCIPTLLLILAWQIWDRIEAANLQRAVEALAAGDRPTRSAGHDDRGWRLYRAAGILIDTSAEQLPVLGRLRDALADDRTIDASLIAAAALFVEQSRDGILVAARAAERPLESWEVGRTRTRLGYDLSASRRVENAYGMVMLHAIAAGQIDDAALAAVNRARLLRVYDRERDILTVFSKAGEIEILGRDVGFLLGRPLPRERLDALDAALDGVLDRAEIADAIRSDALDQRVMGVLRRPRVAIPVLFDPKRPLVVRQTAEGQQRALECVSLLNRPWPELIAATPPVRSESRGGVVVVSGQLCSRTVRAVARALAVVRSLRLAVRVERQRLTAGGLPDRLPEPLAQPAEDLSDPFTGEPMLYRRTTDGYVIYSVGADGNDDGGSVTDSRSRSSPVWGRAVAGKDFGVQVRVRSVAVK
jgi:hypothetical protein